MGWKVWQDGEKKHMTSATLIQSFHLLTTTTLSLLIPLSFLLLARLSPTYPPFTLSPYPKTYPSNHSFILISLIVNTTPFLLQALVSLIASATLIHGLTGQKLVHAKPPEPIFRPYLCISWIFLCTLQLCVGLDIEGSIASGIDGYGFGHDRSLSVRVFFFLGLHETMLYWWRVVVKPVIDDTVFGFLREERWVDRVAIAGGFGALWWWRLRREVEILVVTVEIKREMATGVDIADFVGCWLYYLTATIGMVMIVRGILRGIGVVLLCRRVEGSPSQCGGNEGMV